MKSMRRSILAGLVMVLTACPLAAQTPDSLIAASYSNLTRLRVNIDGGMYVGGAYDGGIQSGGIPLEGSGTRLMWFPNKAAFRVGHISGTQWNDANTGYFSVAMGRDVQAHGENSIALGIRSSTGMNASAAFAAGEDNVASGAASVALGYHAHTNARQGSFVFSDRSSVDTLRAGVNHSANWRVSGGFRIFTASNLSTGVTIQSGASVSNWGQSSAVISTSTGASLTTGGVWQNASDVNRKHAFEDVAGEEILTALRDLPIRKWTYDSEDETVRHLGPTSQDFRQAFGLGSDELSIGTVDADGVALLGVQTLERRTSDQLARIEKLEQENAALRDEMARLKSEADELAERLQRIEAAMEAGGS